MMSVIQMSHLCGHLSIISTLVLLKFLCVMETLGPNTRGVPRSSSGKHRFDGNFIIVILLCMVTQL